MTSPIITDAIRVLVDRRDLSRIEAAAAMEAIMSGAATNAQIAAFLTALRMKGETVEELIGFAQVMRQKVVSIRTRAGEVAGLTGTDREMLIDTCGTGGDATGTFNVSTATAFVVAGSGLRVAKHGNRSASSKAATRPSPTCGASTCSSPRAVATCASSAIRKPKPNSALSSKSEFDHAGPRPAVSILPRSGRGRGNLQLVTTGGFYSFELQVNRNTALNLVDIGDERRRDEEAAVADRLAARDDRGLRVGRALEEAEDALLLLG